MLTALIATRELAREPGSSIIHNLITSHAVPEIVPKTVGRRCAPGSGTRSSRARWRAPGAIFGGEHSGHFYFRDFWRADSGMLAALHVMAALGTQERPAVRHAVEYSRYAASGEINSEVSDQGGPSPRRSSRPSAAAPVSGSTISTG